MKLAKLSLAAMMVAGLASSSFAADTLADAFKNGSVKGEIKAYYFNSDDDTSREDIFTTGLMLNYKTATLYGFGANFTFQGSSSPFSDNDGEARYQGSMYGPGAVLSEAYLSYTMGKTTAMAGRMFLSTPLVSGSGSRVVKEAFEGVAVINTDLPDTTLIAGYVQKFQARTSGDGDAPKFGRTFKIGSSTPNVELDDGAFTLVAINKSITGLTLTAAYAQTGDLVDENGAEMDRLSIAYAEADYQGKAGKFAYGIAAQYYYNNFGGLAAGINADENSLFGVKASVGYDAFGAYVAYSKVNDKTNGYGVVSGLGNGADLAYTMSPINSNSYGNDTEAYKIGATYAIMKNANVGLSYTLNEIDSVASNADKKAYTAVEADYAFEGALKGLSTTVIYEDGSKDASGTDELWVKANYKF